MRRSRLRWRLRNLKYWFLHRFTKRHSYHVVRTGLPPGYYDTDTRMLHACMSLMTQFVELERGGRDQLSLDLAFYPEQNEDKWAQAMAELLIIYDWWKAYDSEAVWALSIDEEDSARKQETDMLKRLMDIRLFLWT